MWFNCSNLLWSWGDQLRTLVPLSLDKHSMLLLMSWLWIQLFLQSKARRHTILNCFLCVTIHQLTHPLRLRFVSSWNPFDEAVRLWSWWLLALLHVELSETLEPLLSPSKRIPSKTSLSVRITPIELLPLLLCLLRNLNHKNEGGKSHTTEAQPLTFVQLR